MDSILTNRHVAEDYNEGFSTFRYQPVSVMSLDKKGRLTLEWRSDDPAVVLSADHAGHFHALLRRDFQAAFSSEADPALVAKVEKAFGQNIVTIRQERRTVGAGAMIYLSLADGIFQPVVERTAPTKTPSGVENAGLYSRAAGGIIKDINETAFNEMTAEMFVGIAGHGSVVPAALIPRFPDLSEEFVKANLDAVAAKRLGQLRQNSSLPVEDTSVVFEAKEFFVESLQEEVTQITDGVSKTVVKATHFDKGSNGDVDSFLVVKMPDIRSGDLIIADGETGLRGEFLNRSWLLERPEVLHEKLERGEMKFSPLPRKLISETPAIMSALKQVL